MASEAKEDRSTPSEQPATTKPATTKPATTKPATTKPGTAHSAEAEVGEQRPNKPSLALRIANPVMKLLLRSPLHGMASSQLMLITVTGRKTGRRYTTPVNYVQNQNELSVVSHQHRTWWRNVRGGAPVLLHLRGRKVAAHAVAVEEPDAVAVSLLQHLREVPIYAEPLGVRLDEEGIPMDEDGLQAAQGKVMIHITLPESEST